LIVILYDGISMRVLVNGVAPFVLYVRASI
jgi:hypothetical protein